MTAAGPLRLPPVARGLRIGLFGGSFDPPHEGHRLASLIAMRRLQLDRVWWLVSPGNPLKNTSGLKPLAVRMAAAEKLANHPRIAVTGLEAALGTPFTCDTIAFLKRRCPGVHFVWLMGADNLSGFHRWKGWRRIADLVPIAVIDRPGSTVRATHAPAATYLAAYRFGESGARRFADAKPPAFIFLHGPRSPLSSTALRGAPARALSSQTDSSG